MLKERFVSLWKNSGSHGSASASESIFQEVVAHYSESHRRYHTMDHIRHCLNQVDRIPSSYPDKSAVELAIWFHDVIFEVGNPMNERLSAEYFRTKAAGDLPDHLIEQVCRLIISTEHLDSPINLDAAYVVDIDLSSFGSPYEEFRRDSAAVRAEINQNREESTHPGQKQFLNALLARDRIFTTDLFNTLFEDQARKNIRKILETLDTDRPPRD